ncbi:MAG: hypothetical protein QM762_26610 [Chryseolinea sp.]
MMLFQFVAPTFLPITTQRETISRETIIGIQHNSIIFPLLLKEKDEKESGETSSQPDLTVLIDLSSHVVNLTAAHDIKHSEVYEEHGIAHPPLFQMFCTFQI